MQGYGKTKQPSVLTFGGCPVINAFNAALSKADDDAPLFACKDIFSCGVADSLYAISHNIRRLCHSYNYTTNLFYASDKRRWPHDSEDKGNAWAKELQKIGINCSFEPNEYHVEEPVTFFNTFVIRIAKSLHNRIIYLTEQGYSDLLTFSEDYLNIYNPDIAVNSISEMVEEARQRIPEGNMIIFYGGQVILFNRDTYMPGVHYIKCYGDGQFIEGSYHPLTTDCRAPEQLSTLAIGTTIAKITDRANAMGRHVPHGTLIERIGFKRVLNTSHQTLIVY